LLSGFSPAAAAAARAGRDLQLVENWPTRAQHLTHYGKKSVLVEFIFLQNMNGLLLLQLEGHVFFLLLYLIDGKYNIE